MNYKIEMHPDAVVELQDAYHWYEERSAGLGSRFLALMSRRINEIGRSPETYRKIIGNYREVMVDVFPYVIIYELFKKEGIVFISYIFHTKRNPRLKYKR